MDYQVTEQQLSDARRFIERRIEVQEAVKDALSRDFEEAAEKIAAIVVKYKERGLKLKFTGNSMMASEIQDVIDWLIHQINLYVATYSVPPEEDDEELTEEIIDDITGEHYGATFDEREDLYIKKYLTALSKLNYDSFDDDEDEIQEAIQEAVSNPTGRIAILLASIIASGWAAWLAHSAEEDDAVGFVVINGNAPCDYCADMEGFHTMDDPAPPYHPNCQCLTVYV